VELPALAAKPDIALRQPEGERKRLIDDIVDFVANKLEDPAQPQGPIYEQALRLVWYELEIDGNQWEPITGGYHIDIGQKTIQKAKAHPVEGDRK